MSKRGLIQKSVWLQNLILKRYHAKLDLVMNGRIITQYMAYDAVNLSFQKKYEKFQDYTRYRTFELIADEIRKRYRAEELSRFCVAEAGVFLGKFAWLINARFPECKIYLYDTFEGFNQDDMKVEVENSYTKEDNLAHYRKLFKEEGNVAEDKIQIVKSRMLHEEQCVFRKGYFPGTAANDADVKWAFVSLDMDLYAPISAGIKFFWPNLVEGGYMFIHDYNNKDFVGVKKALQEAEMEFGEIKKVPLSDQGGTIILCK